jgi:hypothetical protein
MSVLRTIKAIMISTVAVLPAFIMSVAAQTNIMKDCGCDKIISSSLLTTQIDSKKDQRDQFKKQFFCYASEETVKNTVDSYMNLGVTVEDLPLELKGGYSESGLKKFRQASCEAKSESDKWTAVVDSYRKYAPPELFASVDKCVQACKDQGGLYCDLNTLDAENLTFFARWRPTGNLVSANIKSLTVIGGRLVTTSNIGGTSLISVDQEILPGGISVPVVRNTISSDVRAVLNSTQGSCEVSQPALTMEYRLKTVVVASGTVVNPVQMAIQSVHHNTNGDCSKKDTGSETFCFADGGVVAKSIGNFFEHTGNCSRSVNPGPVGAPTPNCAVANWMIEGCGYNFDIGVAKNCKGNGWLTFGGTLVGEKETAAQPIKYEQLSTFRVSPGQTGSVSVQFPMDQISSWKQKNMVVDVTITKFLQGRELGTIALNQQNVSLDGASLSFNPQSGQGSIQVKNLSVAP